MCHCIVAYSAAFMSYYFITLIHKQKTNNKTPCLFHSNVWPLGFCVHCNKISAVVVVCFAILVESERSSARCVLFLIHFFFCCARIQLYSVSTLWIVQFILKVTRWLERSVMCGFVCRFVEARLIVTTATAVAVVMSGAFCTHRLWSVFIFSFSGECVLMAFNWFVKALTRPPFCSPLESIKRHG